MLTSASKQQANTNPTPPNTSKQDNNNCTLREGEDSTIRYNHNVIELKLNCKEMGILMYRIRVFLYLVYNSERKNVSFIIKTT